MRDKKTFGIVGVIILVLVVISAIGIAYASFNQNLEIGGTATVQKTSWKIRFKNISTPTITGAANVVTAPTLTDTTVNGFAITLKKPGDSVVYTFDVSNEGSYDAKISTITIPTPSVTGTGANKTTDEANVSSKISYTLTYSDGSAINAGDTLNVGQTKRLKLKLSYANFDDASLLPANDVAIGNLTIPITYVQS